MLSATLTSDKPTKTSVSSVVVVNTPKSLHPQLRAEICGDFPQLAVEFAGMEDILARLSVAEEWTGKPEENLGLLIVRVTSFEDVEQIARWRSCFPHQPILVLLEHGCDPASLKEALDESVTRVANFPFQPGEFQAALKSLLQESQSTEKDHRILAVAGATGGCGVTTLALNIGYELATHYHHRSLLVDLALQMGALATSLNLEPTYTIQDVLKHIDSQHGYAFQKAITPVTENLSLIAAPYQTIESIELEPNRILEMIHYCRRWAEWTVLDVPCTYDDLYFKTLNEADHIVLVAQQRVPSIRAAKLICDRLSRDGALAGIHLVMNGYDPKVKGLRLSELEKLLPVQAISGVAQDAAGVTEAVNQGRPLRLATPRSPALADIDALCDTLTGTEAMTEEVIRDLNVFGRLAATFGLL
jgi:pilus assembly protein CpaE